MSELRNILYKAYKYALSILPQRAKFFSIPFCNKGLFMAFGKFLLNIETTMYVSIDALRNISPSELCPLPYMMLNLKTVKTVTADY